MDIPQATAALKPGFLTMPGEIRNAIYRMLLTNEYVNQSLRLTCSPLHPAILQVNRQIYKEAVNILHGENIWIIAHIPAHHFSLIFRTISRFFRKNSDYTKYPAVHINWDLPVATETVTFIMGDQGVQDFADFLRYMSTDEATGSEFTTSSLNLTLCETPFHTKSKLESTCLRPFGFVYGLRSLTIQGQVEPACIKEVLHNASSGFKDMTQVQSVSQAYIDRGDEAYFAGELFKAKFLYSHGCVFLSHVLRRIHNGATQPIAISGDMVIIYERLGWTWTLCVRADLARGEYETTKRVGYSILRSFFITEKKSMILMLCIARAHRALGEEQDERRIFEEALGAHSDNYFFLSALAELFPIAAPEKKGLLYQQQAKLQSGESIDLDVIRAFWVSV